jgi:hypothetical protein
MNVENVYVLLEKLKKCDSHIQEKSKRFLKYIYHDVYFECFEKEKNLEVERMVADGAQIGSIRYYQIVKPYDESLKALSIFLEGDNSSLSYFLDMINDKDERFINLFFDKVSTYFEIMDNHFYRDDDFKSFSFTFNIYTMLKAYDCWKDNYEVFSKVLNDCSFLIDCKSIMDMWKSKRFDSFPERKKMIDLIVGCKIYSDVNVMGIFLSDVLKNIGKEYKYNEADVLKTISFVEEVFLDYQEVSKFILQEKMVSLDDFISKNILNNNDFDKSFYAKSLLVGNRFDFVNERLNEVFINYEYRLDAFSEIKSFDYIFFEYLNRLEKYKDKDSFIEVLNILFDSDTFYEYNSKVEDVKKAMSLFSNGEFDSSLEIINSLDSDKYKKVIDGKMVTYTNDSVNLISKNPCIYNRTKELYFKFYSSLDIDVSDLVEHVHYSSNLKSFDKDLDRKIAQRINNVLAIRKLEEKRHEMIREEVDELARVLKENTNFKGDHNIYDVSEKEEKPKQKLMGLFSRK